MEVGDWERRVVQSSPVNAFCLCSPKRLRRAMSDRNDDAKRPRLASNIDDDAENDGGSSSSAFGGSGGASSDSLRPQASLASSAGMGDADPEQGRSSGFGSSSGSGSGRARLHDDPPNLTLQGSITSPTTGSGSGFGSSASSSSGRLVRGSKRTSSGVALESCAVEAAREQQSLQLQSAQSLQQQSAQSTSPYRDHRGNIVDGTQFDLPPNADVIGAVGQPMPVSNDSTENSNSSSGDSDPQSNGVVHPPEENNDHLELQVRRLQSVVEEIRRAPCRQENCQDHDKHDHDHDHDHGQGGSGCV